MKKELMNILACPVCNGELELTVDKENEEEVVAGSLYCPRCDVRYPIADTIPHLWHEDVRDRQSLILFYSLGE